MSDPYDHPPPTTAELYLRATRSSHLELKERRGDTDRIIAAGLSGNSLGALLWRLVDEYAARDETIKVHSPSNDLRTHRLLVLMDMKTLRPARDRLMCFAEDYAVEHNFDLDDGAVHKIAGRCLESWLDKRCHHCSGRGFTGGAHRGDRQVTCRPCNGSGDRRDWIGKTGTEIRFASELMGHMSAALSEAERDWRRNRTAVDEAKAWIAEQVRTT